MVPKEAERETWAGLGHAGSLQARGVGFRFYSEFTERLSLNGLTIRRDNFKVCGIIQILHSRFRRGRKGRAVRGRKKARPERFSKFASILGRDEQTEGL